MPVLNLMAVSIFCFKEQVAIQISRDVRYRFQQILLSIPYLSAAHRLPMDGEAFSHQPTRPLFADLMAFPEAGRILSSSISTCNVRVNFAGRGLRRRGP
jgi:hypothetical protein